MYETFDLRQFEKGVIRGYHWPQANPDKVVCIVHGIGEYGGRYDRVATEFAKANLATISMDLRGHGDSIEKKGHCAPREEVLSDIDALIEFAQETYPGKPIILYGHSMGGNITLDYRSRGELNSVPSKYMISAPWVRLVRPIPAPLYALVKVMAKIKPDMTISSAVDEDTLGHPDRVKPYNDNPMVHNKISAATAVAGFDIGISIEKGTMLTNSGALGTPTLLMHGSADKICDVEGSRKAAKHIMAETMGFVRMNKPEASDEEVLAETDKLFEYKEWEGLFHEIHNGNSESKGDEVIAKMIEFITA